MIERLPARLVAKIDATGECWLWTAAQDGKGYGAVWHNGRVVKAHVVIYELLVGPVPEGLELDHVQARGCTSKACVRPDHLEPVTHAENMRRAGLSGIGAENSAKTGCPKGHPYDPSSKPGARRCTSCRRDTTRAASRRYRARLQEAS